MVIAIDPGANGGIAILDSSGVARAMKLTPDSAYHTLAGETETVYIEDVGYHVRGNNAQASCTFARHVGWLQGVCYALGKKVILVTPKEWQPYVLCHTRYKTKTERKREIKRTVRACYPHIKVTLYTADALGILLYAMDVKEKGKQ